MPGLVQRHNVIEEYATLISTNPSSIRRRRNRQLERDVGAGPSTTRAALTDEAEEWYEAIYFSQERVFAFLAPLVVFGALFTVVVIAVQPHSFAHRILEAPHSRTEDMLKIGGMLAGGILLSLLVLKCATWGVAESSSVVLSMESRSTRSRKEREGVPSTNMVFGGIFM
ncbi:hypothetical protein C8Q78DRAFT_1079035 [Trametes maxima]|nr:hypothetical protein C8Q78DRAFT_1079035 [Trametes maxima]